MKKKSKAVWQVLHNKDVHDSVVSSYEDIHAEIFNPTEQARIASVLQEALAHIKTQSAIPRVLDFGAGTGNLTKHLLSHGVGVIAADVSSKSLASLVSDFGETGSLDTLELNGTDLSNLEDRSLDMVATYSVLHHVLDYLKIVKEFVRVVKPGGVIYIDHEKASELWLEESDEYSEYKREMQKLYRQPFLARLTRKVGLLFSLTAWRRLINREFFGLNPEGDIHVTKDDHIEWDRIENILLEQCEMRKGEEYLVCRELDPTPPLHEKYGRKCVDMRFIIYSKN